MVRSLTTDASNKLNQQYGGEPVSIVGIKWNNATEIKYATKDLTGIQGRIKSLAALNNTIQVDGSSTAASFNLVLDDSDGELKSIIDTVDIHKNQCILYQWFEGLDLSDAFVLFRGEVNSPIVWNESERTLSFTVLSKIESKEVGFAPEEGQFETVSPGLVGKVWPLAFGDVVHVPATQAVEKVRGSTQTLIGIPDYTLPFKYWHLQERLTILRTGFAYYRDAIHSLLGVLPQLSVDQGTIWTLLQNPELSNADAITYFFNYITATAQALEDQYVALILSEDQQKQEFENYNVLITKLDKRRDDMDELATTVEDIETSAYNELQSELDDSLEEARGVIEDSTVLIEAQRDSILSQMQTAFDSHKASGASLLAANQDADALAELVEQFNSITSGLKAVSEITDKSLEIIRGRKDIFEVDLDNSEYAFQNIKSILRKLNTVYINQFKTNREIYKVSAAIQQHNLLPRNQVVVTNGEQFPQNESVKVTINGMTYRGHFAGKTFTVSAIEPKYLNVAIHQNTRTVDSFTLVDDTIDLTDHYCLVAVPTTPQSVDYDLDNPYGYRIFQVIQQVGQRCVMRLLELNPTKTISSKTNRVPLIKELPSYLVDLLADANEHTIGEKRRILEDAIPKYDADELERIKDTLEKLKDIATEAPDDDTINAINDTIYKKVKEYNDRVSKLTYKREAIIKASEKISEAEHNHLLRLQNLKYRLSDTDDDDFEILATNRYYYITGFEVTSIIAASPVMLPGWFQFSPQGQELEQNNTVISLPNGSRIKANFLPDSGLWYAEIGSSVELADQLSEKYICNILPSSIKSVYAYKTTNGVKQLLPVPSSRYTKNESDSYGALTCTSITLEKRLSDYPNEGWEDGLYVSMQSSVGPNTAEIIQWILQNYTTLSIDSTSFTAVATKLTNYPSSFALFDKKDALALVQEIALQARCSVYVVDNTAYIMYLSEEPTEVDTITDSDILTNSLSLEHTETEGLVTKLTANWKPNYAVSKDNQIVLRTNVPKYGTMARDFDFYIYNIESLVEKSATFLLIRKANTWKRIKFETALNKLHLEIFDTVLLDLADNPFSNEPVLGLIEQADYDSTTNTISFSVWLPVRSGEMTAYDFAWPSSIAVDKIYPTVEDISAGIPGSGLSTVPTNLAYNISPNTGLIDQLALRPKDYGRPFLSDEYDTFPDSVLTDLVEEDYITVVPEKYELPAQPRATELNTKPEYENTVTTPVNQEKSVGAFVGRITSVVDAQQGLYKVKTANNREYEVQQVNGGSLALSVNQPVTAIYDGPSGQWVMNETTSTTGSSSLYLAEVTTGSASGLTTSYTCDIFNGQDASAFAETLLAEDEIVFQDTNNSYFFHRELVAVHNTGGRWVIQKLCQTPLWKNFTEDDGLVLRPADTIFTGNYSHKFPALTGTQYYLADYVVPFRPVIDKLREDFDEFYEGVYANNGYIAYVSANDTSLIPMRNLDYSPLELMADVVGDSLSGMTPDLLSYGKRIGLTVSYNYTANDISVPGAPGIGTGSVNDSSTYVLNIGTGSTISQTVSIAKSVTINLTHYLYRIDTIRQNANSSGDPIGSPYVYSEGLFTAYVSAAAYAAVSNGTQLTTPTLHSGISPDPAHYYEWLQVANRHTTTSSPTFSAYSGALICAFAGVSATSPYITPLIASLKDAGLEKLSNHISMVSAQLVCTGLDRTVLVPATGSYDATASATSGAATFNYTLHVG